MIEWGVAWVCVPRWGSVEVQTRTRTQHDGTVVGESRRVERDEHGAIELVTEWEASGVVLRPGTS